MCVYRKGYNTQYALLALLEQWKQILESQGYAGTAIMDLSKAFATVNYELLLAKLYAYGFDKSALNMVDIYLINRWHRTKINYFSSNWRELISGVPQDPYFLIFILMICFLFLMKLLFIIMRMTLVCMLVTKT